MLGAMFAVHSDNKGLVIPPKIAENKIVIIPILIGKEAEKIIKESEKIKKELEEFSPLLDKRTEYSPGWKYNEWELKGIPLRIEIGPKDIEKKQVVVVKRNDSKKLFVLIKDLKKEIKKLIEEMHQELYKNSEKMFKSAVSKTEEKNELIKIINSKKIAVSPMCNSEVCEDTLKEKTNGAKTLFIDPDNTPINNKKCVICGKPANYWLYIGKTY
jgi:prolyl-tRNA synthetase